MLSILYEGYIEEMFIFQARVFIPNGLLWVLMLEKYNISAEYLRSYV